MSSDFSTHPAGWSAPELLVDPRFDRRAPTARLPRGELPQVWRQELGDIARELEQGCGAVRLRGLDLAGMDDEAAHRLFVRLTDPLGTPLSQDVTGATVLRVEDRGHASDDPRHRGPNSRARLSYHCDRCDVIAFLCVRPAERGGATRLVSSVRLHQRLLEEEPRTLEVLRGSFPFLRHTIDPVNPRSFVLLPIFSERDGHFAAHLLRVLIDRADSSPEAPSLTIAQRSALDRLEELAEEEGVSFQLAPGDLLLLQNWVTFHRRDAFEDDSLSPRLLLRRWISTRDNRPLDPRFLDHFGSVEAGRTRGGIRPLRT